MTTRWVVRFALVLSALLPVMAVAQTPVSLVELSSDPFTNTSSQHATEVEPDTYAFGSTIVTAFQTGRIADGGSTDIGFATSTNGGSSWTHGWLPGITTFYKGGTYQAASDAAVAYDAAHGKWLVTSIALINATGVAVLASSSSDGLTWNNPVIVNNKSAFADKDWVSCDSNSSSPFYGHCYVEWEDAGIGDQVEMSTSTDGGQTWSSAFIVKNAIGLGGQPIVQPNGTAVVSFLSFSGNGAIGVFTSTNGGTSWGSLGAISNVTSHAVAGDLRAVYELPSASIDGAGTIYVAWFDCRFRTNCSSNDIVYSSSSNGTTWSAVSRVPIDAVTSTVDHFIPGLGVDPTTSGSSAHLGLLYYYYPVANCSESTCKLSAGFISSTDAGSTWTTPTTLLAGMNNTWLPTTTLGQMVGDYMSTAYVDGKAFGIFAGAKAPSGGKFFEVMATTKTGFLESGTGPMLSSAGEKPVPNAKSDHGPYAHWDSEGRISRPTADPD